MKFGVFIEYDYRSKSALKMSTSTFWTQSWRCVHKRNFQKTTGRMTGVTVISARAVIGSML